MQMELKLNLPIEAESIKLNFFKFLKIVYSNKKKHCFSPKNRFDSSHGIVGSHREETTQQDRAQKSSVCATLHLQHKLLELSQHLAV